MNNNIIDLVKELAALKSKRDMLIEESKAMYARMEEISKIELPTLMDDNGVSNITVEGVGRVNLQGGIFASILEANRDEAFEWLRSTGKESLITEVVNASTLKAAAKQWLMSGEPIPECIKITPYTAAVLTSIKGGKKTA